MSTTELTTPVEIDTAISEQMMVVAKLDDAITRQERYRDSDDGYLRARFDPAEYGRLKAEWDREVAKNQALQDLYTGWPRYWHVQNNNGHIHTSQSCSSCFPDTQFAWRTDLSGLTVEEVVEREAYNACTVCMPIAPAEQKAAREYYNRQQREARAAEKQAKADAKLKAAAERAVKFLAKVDKQVETTFGSWESLWAEYSLHGHDGKKSLYTATYDMPSQVANYLYDEMSARTGQRGSRHMKDPKATLAEAREKGLVA